MNATQLAATAPAESPPVSIPRRAAPALGNARAMPRVAGEESTGAPSTAIPTPSATLAPTLVPSRFSRARRPLTKREQLMVVTQLSIMLRSGVDLAEAVRSIAQRSASERTRAAMSKVYLALESGHLLSQALAGQREHFGGVMVASVAAGEASGRLEEVLSRLSVIIRDELRLLSAIRSAISYPLVLSLVTLLVLTAMIFFVLPQFAGIYAASRAPTPPITRWLLAGAEVARGYSWLLLGASLSGAAASYRYLRSRSGRRATHRLMLRLPIVRVFCRSLFGGRMFRLQGVMLDSGVSMLDVLQLTRESVGNCCFEELTDEIRASVVIGEGMAAALRRVDFIPDGAAEMIATAEANGQLGRVLQTVGEFYETEGEQQLRDAVKIAEPAIIVGLGLVVGVIVLAVMLPLLDLSTAGGM